MPKVAYDFRIEGCPDWKRVAKARSRLRKSGSVESITCNHDDLLDGGQIDYLLLYKPAAAIVVCDWYATDEYLVGNAPLKIICENAKRPKVKAVIEQILGTSLVKRTEYNTIVRKGPSPVDCYYSVLAEALSGCKGDHVPKPAA